MKVQIFTEHLDRIDMLTDNEKVLMGLLTFLHDRFREHNLFRIWASDIRTILDKPAVGALTLNKDVFVVAKFGYRAIYYGLGPISEPNDKSYIDIKDLAACTSHGYLLGLYKHKKEWNDVFQRQVDYYLDRKSTFSHEERDQYFKSPENRIPESHASKKHLE